MKVTFDCEALSIAKANEKLVKKRGSGISLFFAWLRRACPGKRKGKKSTWIAEYSTGRLT
jgi:hypothetical protein